MVYINRCKYKQAHKILVLSSNEPSGKPVLMGRHARVVAAGKHKVLM